MTKNENLQVFDFKEQAVRVVVRDDGEPWWVAKDVCNVLELSNPTEALKMLEDDEKMTLRNSEGHSGQRGGAQMMNIISESGLYALIFRSNKPEAKKFRKWVTSEVIPSIRKTGNYTAGEMTTSPDKEKTPYLMIEKLDALITTAQYELGLSETTVETLCLKLAEQIVEWDITEQMRQRCFLAGESGEEVGIIYKILPDRASSIFPKSHES